MNSAHMRALAMQLQSAAEALREAADFQDKHMALAAGVDLSANPEILNLCVRTRKALSRAGIRAIGDLIGTTEDQLLSMQNISVSGLNEIKTRLADVGLELSN